MEDKYKVLDYPIRLLLARELKETVQTWERLSKNGLTSSPDIAKSNADYYRQHLDAVESTFGGSRS